MKKYFTLAFLFCLVAFSHAEFSYKEMLFVPWGTTPGSAGLRLSPGWYYGPRSFSVQNDTIILLDSENNRVMLFKEQKYQKNIAFSLPFADDIAWISNDLYYLLSDNQIFEISDNSIQMKLIK